MSESYVQAVTKDQSHNTCVCYCIGSDMIAVDETVYNFAHTQAFDDGQIESAISLALLPLKDSWRSSCRYTS